MSSLITQYRRFKKRISQIDELIRRVDDLQKAVGRVEGRQLSASNGSYRSLQDFEFKVYSQWGEDGIIQFLVRNVPIENRKFVEFGVQDYKESNTRFLLQHDSWSGLVMDCSADEIEKIRRDGLYWRNDLCAVCAFIDRDNINTLLTENGFQGDIGLLSIDIDGNDYWVWEAVEAASPRIVVCEYDSLLGCERAVTTPYDRNFDRTKAHYSFLYGGASIAALHKLASRKGYALVGSNSSGVNAFFVRNDVLGSLKPLTPEQGYVKISVRNSKDREGNLTYLSFEDSRKLIADMPFFDVDRNELVRARDIFHR
jgi:hypothetical protein